MKQCWELERLEEERRQMATLRRKAELGCVGSLGSSQRVGFLPSQTSIGSPQNQSGCGLYGAVVNWPCGLKLLDSHL